MHVERIKIKIFFLSLFNLNFIAGTRSSGGVLVMTVTAALAICACLL